MIVIMTKLGNYIEGNWVIGDGDGQPLYHAATGELIAHASSKGLDFSGMLDYARKTGNPALRKMTFPERGRMLRALALYLKEPDRLEKFYRISYQTGATRADSWIDLEGGISSLTPPSGGNSPMKLFAWTAMG
jgi:oxepin-CoA hydrolase / 3-oxo-5,6-dehydrosuberyl-CoA semialdehyde dehydrogenase